jgi:hypothetical protein
MSRRILNLVMVLLLPVGLVLLLTLIAGANRDTKTIGVAAGPVSAPDGTWSDLPPLPTVVLNWGSSPGSPSPLKLKRAGAVAYPPNGKIYILGGRHRSDGDDINSQWIWEYTPGNSTFIRKNAVLDSSLYGSRFTSNMAVVVLTDTNGPRIYAVGGSSVNSMTSNAVRVYDPNSDTLSTSDAWPASPGRMPGGYAVYNNKLYIFGGYTSQPTGVVYADTWVFDPMAASGSKWQQLAGATLGTARAFIAGATLDGYIYAIGGDTISGSTTPLVTPLSIVERMNPSDASPTWQAVASLPTARGDMSAWAYDTGTGYEISGNIVVAGGPFPTPDTIAYIYDPAADAWNTFTPMLRARRNFAAAQLGGMLYAWGGYNVSANGYDGSNDSMVYDGSVQLTPTPPAVTNTPVVPTNTAVPPTNTAVPPTSTTVPPTGTSVSATNTSVSATNTTVPPTGTVQAPTSTPAEATSTPEGTPAPCMITFTDVPPGSTFYDFVRCLVCRGIVTGYPDNTFRPDNLITRGQLSKIVALAVYLPDPGGDPLFEDVPLGSPFFGYIQALATEGYMSGYACGGDGEPCGPDNLPYFRPYNQATRAQISKIVSNAAGFTEPGGVQIFEDVPDGSTFFDFIQRLGSRQIMSGYPCGGPGEPCGAGNRPYFRPYNNATRGQVSKIVSNTWFPDCGPLGASR